MATNPDIQARDAELLREQGEAFNARHQGLDFPAKLAADAAAERSAESAGLAARYGDTSKALASLGLSPGNPIQPAGATPLQGSPASVANSGSSPQTPTDNSGDIPYLHPGDPPRVLQSEYVNRMAEVCNAVKHMKGVNGLVVTISRESIIIDPNGNGAPPASGGGGGTPLILFVTEDGDDTISAEDDKGNTYTVYKPSMFRKSVYNGVTDTLPDGSHTYAYVSSYMRTNTVSPPGGGTQAFNEIQYPPYQAGDELVVTSDADGNYYDITPGRIWASEFACCWGGTTGFVLTASPPYTTSIA